MTTATATKPDTTTKPERKYTPPASLWDLPTEVFAPGYHRFILDRCRLLIDRFWDLVQVCDGDGCWLWPGETRSNGYGLFEVLLGAHGGGRWRVRFRTHRLAWESVYGPIPDGLFVLHECDVKRCCRPGHLHLGTTLDNSHDMMRKGRSASAQFTPDEVRAIRRRLAAGEGPTAIAREVGTRPAAIVNIRKGRTYKWVPSDN